MPDPSGTWKVAKTSPVVDPLKGYEKRPLISGGEPSDIYLGRIIVEFWDTGSGDDTDGIALQGGAINGKHAEFFERVVKALSEMMQKGNPYSAS